MRKRTRQEIVISSGSEDEDHDVILLDDDDYKGFVTLHELEVVSEEKDEASLNSATEIAGREEEKKEEADAQTGFVSLNELEEFGKLEGEYECPICLSPCESAAMLDGCYHCFDFVCLIQWIYITPSCPLCKRGFKSILYDIKMHPTTQQIEFKRFFPDKEEPPDAVAKAQKAKRSMGVAVGFLQPSASQTSFSSQFSLAQDKRFFDLSEVERRRAVYAHGLKAVLPPLKKKGDAITKPAQKANMMTMKKRLRTADAQAVCKPPDADAASDAGIVDLSSLYFCRMPPLTPRLWEQKLRTWTTRELQALLKEDDVGLIVLMVKSLLENYVATKNNKDKRAPSTAKQMMVMKEEEDAAFDGMKRVLVDYLFDNTERFLHELLCCAISDAEDVESYDRSVRYHLSTQRNNIT